MLILLLDMISSSTGTGKKSGVGSGKETLRLRSKGPATVQVVSENKEHHMTAVPKSDKSLVAQAHLV